MSKNWNENEVIPLFPREKKSFFNNLYWQIRWKLRDAYYWVVNLPHRINNLIKWFNLIFYDFDFDYIYLLKIMQFKLKNMREHFVEHNLVVTTPEIEKSIKRVEELIQKYMDDEYLDKFQQEHEKKWGETIHELLPSDDNGLTRRLDSYTKKAREEDREEEERQEYRQILDKSEELKQKDWNSIWDELKSKCQMYWD